MESTMTLQPQSAQLKHYYKNKENVLAYYHSYYQQNKERIKQQRRERYASQQAQRAATQFAEILETPTMSD